MRIFILNCNNEINFQAIKEPLIVFCIKIIILLGNDN